MIVRIKKTNSKKRTFSTLGFRNGGYTSLRKKHKKPMRIIYVDREAEDIQRFVENWSNYRAQID